jgi:perosamine synthetase
MLIRQIIKDVGNLLRGRRTINFYFPTVTLSDSLWALFKAATALFTRSAQAGDSVARQRFRGVVCQDLQVSNAYLFGSARSALYSILRCLQLEAGSEVLVTGFTCEVVPNAVMQAGLEPRYVDIDAKNLCMDPCSVSACITPRTRVLIVQHTFGIPAPIEELLTMARQYGLFVIEDCAVAIGSRYRGRPVGSWGDAAIYSFELSKIITSCRGGMLVVNDEAVKTHMDAFYEEEVPEQTPGSAFRALLQLGLSGLLYRPHIFHIGKYIVALFFRVGLFSYSTTPVELQAGMPADYLVKLSSGQAAMLLRQWQRLPQIIEANCRASRAYAERLRGGGVILPQIDGVEEVNLIRYPLLVEDRSSWIECMTEAGIEAGLWFTAPLSSTEVNQELFGYREGMCPQAEWVAQRIINLPTHLRLRKRDIKRILAVAING